MGMSGILFVGAWEFLHLFSKCLLSVYSVPDTFLGVRDVVRKEIDNPSLELTSQWGETIHKKSKTCSMFYVMKATKKLSREGGLKSWEAALKF